jgi:hypothetical protein
MKSSDTYQLDHSCAILAVGEPKTGKTSLMMAFPDPAILDLDGNLSSAVRRHPTKKFLFDDPATNDKTGAIRPVHERWNHIVATVKSLALDKSVRTICVDGLGVLSEYLIAHILNESVKAGASKRKGAGFDGGLEAVMEIQHYGDFARLMRSFIMLLRATRKIIFVTSHQTADKDENTGALRYYLSIPGQTKETLGGLFTDVWATTATPKSATETKYAIRTKPTGVHVSLGTSFPLDAEIDVTNKTPEQIWSLLSPKLLIK